jgi:hypothetical protein
MHTNKQTNKQKTNIKNSPHTKTTTTHVHYIRTHSHPHAFSSARTLIHMNSHPHALLSARTLIRTHSYPHARHVQTNRRTTSIAYEYEYVVSQELQTNQSTFIDTTQLILLYKPKCYHLIRKKKNIKENETATVSQPFFLKNKNIPAINLSIRCCEYMLYNQ